MPVAVIFSSLNMLAWYAYMFQYRRAIDSAPATRPIKLWNAALAFLFVASLGAWGRAVLVALKVEDVFASTAMVHLFLDLFSSGWALLGLLGLAYASHPELARSISEWEDPLLFLGLPLSFLLGLPVDLVPTDLRTLAGFGGLMLAGGLVLHIRALWPVLGRTLPGPWKLPLLLLFSVAGMTAGVALVPVARWGEQMGLRILYLHVLLLGWITLGLMAARQSTWQAVPGSAARGLSWTILALLASLLPLSGLWPAGLSGTWTLGMAAVAAWGPVLAALYGLFWEAALLSKGAASRQGVLKGEKA
jgi:hypothetical protein